MSTELMHGMADGTAEEFILAGVKLSKECADTRYIAPTIVCFSFAIELHIKAILASCSIDPEREHNLYKLYFKLPDEKKSWVFKMYREVEGDVSLINFESELKRWSSAFIEVRYYHDRTNKSEARFDFSNFIPNLAIALNNGYLHTEKHDKYCFPQL